MKTYVTKKHSEKTGRDYACLMGEKGGRTFILSFDKYLCLSIADISPRELEELNEGDSIEV